MALAKAPPLGTSFMGLAWVGPGIIQYGTPEQKRRFIPDILDSKVSWCTGYSEPNYGSDLASIQTKAVRQGDHYVVNGQKIWTSGRAMGRLDHSARAHRFRAEGEARRHHVPAGRYEDARRRSAADREHGRRSPLRRSVLHRRRSAGGEPPRRGRQGLGRHRVGAGERTLEHRRSDADVRQARHVEGAREENAPQRQVRRRRIPQCGGRSPSSKRRSPR